MELLVKRLLESNLIGLHENPNGSAAMMGIRVDPLLLAATPNGRSYYSSLGLETADWSASDA
jgi:hypothetical protein